jgi:hypothetical protein
MSTEASADPVSTDTENSLDSLATADSVPRGAATLLCSSAVGLGSETGAGVGAAVGSVIGAAEDNSLVGSGVDV